MDWTPYFSTIFISLLTSSVITLVVLRSIFEAIVNKYLDTSTIASLSEKVNQHETKIAELEEFKNTTNKRPVSLTEKGKAVLTSSKGKDYIEKHKVELLDLIKSHNPTTEYELQTCAEDILNKKWSNISFNEIKNYALNEDKNIGSIIKAMSVYLSELALTDDRFDIIDRIIK